MDPYFLSKGGHKVATDGRCAMEWVSYLAGEPHSDSPACVSPVLTRFCIAFNDALDDESRQKLRPYLARTIGTRGDGLDEERAWLATDWLIRTYTPTWLSLAGLDDAAARLRVLPPVLAVKNLSRAMTDLTAARGEAAAAWAEAAARDAASDTAWAEAAAWAAARAAARDAAWAAARAAAWDVRAAAWDVAGDVASDAASVVASDVASVAAASVAAARGNAALKPTVLELQASAFVLLDRMLPTEVIQIPVRARLFARAGVS